MRKVDTVQVAPRSTQPFLLGEEQTYRIAILGYIDKDDPSSDAIFDPMDITKVKVVKQGELQPGLYAYSAINGCDCGVNIEILER